MAKRAATVEAEVMGAVIDLWIENARATAKSVVERCPCNPTHSEVGGAIIALQSLCRVTDGWTPTEDEKRAIIGAMHRKLARVREALADRV